MRALRVKPGTWRTSFVAIALLATACWAAAQSSGETQDSVGPVALTGTLAKVRAAGVIVLGHRESSVPFSYLSARGEPIGYSVDLCKLIVDAISLEVGKPIVSFEVDDVAAPPIATASSVGVSDAGASSEAAGTGSPAEAAAKREPNLVGYGAV